MPLIYDSSNPISWILIGDSFTVSPTGTNSQGRLNEPLQQLLDNDAALDADIDAAESNLGTHNHDYTSVYPNVSMTNFERYYTKNRLITTNEENLIHKNQLFPVSSKELAIIFFNQEIIASLSGTKRVKPGVFVSSAQDLISIPLPSGLSVDDIRGVVYSAYVSGGHDNQVSMYTYPDVNEDRFSWNGSSWVLSNPYPVSTGAFLRALGGEVGKYGTNGFTTGGCGLCPTPAIFTGGGAVAIYGVLVEA